MEHSETPENSRLRPSVIQWASPRPAAERSASANMRPINLLHIFNGEEVEIQGDNQEHTETCDKFSCGMTRYMFIGDEEDHEDMYHTFECNGVEHWTCCKNPETTSQAMWSSPCRRDSLTFLKFAEQLTVSKIILLLEMTVLEWCIHVYLNYYKSTCYMSHWPRGLRRLI